MQRVPGRLGPAQHPVSRGALIDFQGMGGILHRNIPMAGAARALFLFSDATVGGAVMNYFLALARWSAIVAVIVICGVVSGIGINPF